MHSIISAGNKTNKRIIVWVVFGFKSAFLCGVLIFLILLLREGAFYYHYHQNFDLGSAALISLGLATSIRVMKGSTMLHGSEVKY